jgi:hypothetical protein
MPGFAKQRSPLLFGQGLLARHSCRLAGEVYLSPSPNRWRRFQTVFGRTEICVLLPHDFGRNLLCLFSREALVFGFGVVTLGKWRMKKSIPLIALFSFYHSNLNCDFTVLLTCPLSLTHS